MMPILKIEDLSISFHGEGAINTVVKNISLVIDSGQIVALVGESGSGESVTALSVLQLLPTPPAEYSQGSILFRENDNYIDLLKIPAKELQHIRVKKI